MNYFNMGEKTCGEKKKIIKSGKNGFAFFLNDFIIFLWLNPYPVEGDTVHNIKKSPIV